MRVLWIGGFGLKSLNDNNTSGYNGGGWLASLKKEIIKCSDVTLGIAFCKEHCFQKVVQDNISYYVVPNYHKSRKDKYLDFIHIKDVTRDEIQWSHYENQLKMVIDDFKPDVIEIFGSEFYFSLAARVSKHIPTVLHFQGILSLYIYIFLPPGISKWQYIMSGKGLRGKYNNFQYLAYWQRSAYREKAVLKAVPHVIGRTDWDKQAIAVLNPNAKYHYGGEILRDVFYENKERTIPSKITISSTISFPTYKGYDVILKVANILKNELHLDFVWNVYGNINPDFIEKQVGLRHEGVDVRLCGVASPTQLRDALLESTMYFHPSYTENSPNSVCEAQILGVPVVASRVGGTDSLVEHGKTGFLYPVTDPYIAAYYIMYLVDNPDVNIAIGKAAKQVATARHDKKKIVNELMETYQEMIDASNG
nr:glycosyltransferase [Prevotella sp.]